MLYVALLVSFLSLALMIAGMWLMQRNQTQIVTFLQSQWTMIQNQNNRAQDELREQLRENRKQAVDLMNRLQAQDLPAYSAMTWQQSAQNAGLVASDPYISRSDEAEAAFLANTAGYGQPIYDEDTELFETIEELTGHKPGEGA